MDFWHVYEAEKAKPEFGNGRLHITSRDRIHLSLSSVEKYSVLLGMNQGMSKRFTEEARYVITKDLTHDLLVSVFDVNTTQSTLLRMSEAPGEETLRKAESTLKRLSRPNLEMRTIGLQDNDIELLSTTERLRAALKPALAEVDLFGSETRHLAFDLKLGMPFNLLLLNRIYRPHELANAQSAEDFTKNKAAINFI